MECFIEFKKGGKFIGCDNIKFFIDFDMSSLSGIVKMKVRLG